MFESNNEIIESKTPAFVAKVNSDKAAMGIKHDRTKPPLVSKYKYRKVNGEINRISITLTKGEVMSHKGKGKYPDNRKAKPFFQPNADDFVNELADEIAANTGEIICGNLCI